MTHLEWVEELRQDLKASLRGSSPGRSWAPTDFAKCGTSATYRKHLRDGETPCHACRQAEARRGRDYRAKQAEELSRIREMRTAA